jgi:hypothetical protein
MTPGMGLRYRKTVAVLTTMHAKERVIAPILRAELGLIVGLAMGVNTERFGSFAPKIERTGTLLATARAKIAAGFDYAPLARVGLASEGGCQRVHAQPAHHETQRLRDIPPVASGGGEGVAGASGYADGEGGGPDRGRRRRLIYLVVCLRLHHH